MPLTARQCETAKCPPNQNTLVLFDGQGLSLRITRKNNNKLWLWQYSYNKKRNQMSIGSYNDLSLAEARTERDRLSKILQSGINPKIAKETQVTKEIEASGHTLAHLYKLATDEKIKDPRNPWSAPHIKRISFSWKHLKPLYNYPISDISKKHLRETLIEIHNKTPTTCQSVKNLLSVIYTYAVNNEIYPTNLVSQFAKDPILRKPRNDEVEKHPPIPTDKLGATYYHISQYKGLVTRHFLFCSGYTSLRVGSLITAQWKNYNEAEGILYIAKELVKNNKAIRCPVPKQMARMFKEILKVQKTLNKNWNQNCFIFSEDGLKHIARDTPNVKLKYIIDRAKLGFHAVAHGNRTVCEDLWEVQRFTDSAINIQQDHSSQTGNQVRDRYKGKDDFFEERSKMLQWTADYLDKEIKNFKKKNNN
jgi:integrase